MCLLSQFLRSRCSTRILRIRRSVWIPPNSLTGKMENLHVPLFTYPPNPSFHSMDSSSSYLHHIANEQMFSEEILTYGMLNEETGMDGGEVKHINVFITMSDVELMDDGFKWRKYGKKKVKSNPNPRNYYKCAEKWCKVKKRIEKDKEDPRYIITTYHGIHNHYAEPTAPAS